MSKGQPLFLAGLFLTTLATLTIEILNTRLLSVITWYHLSFFAVSTAMFGMAAGAIHVYLGGAKFQDANARRALARYGTLFTLSIPIGHIVTLIIPIQTEITAVNLSALTATTVAIAVPFFASGVLVAIALTRIEGSSGLIYAVDLIGAALGSLVFIPLINETDISSVALFTSAIAAAGTMCFHLYSKTGRWRGVLALALFLCVAAYLNGLSRSGLRVAYQKGMALPPVLIPKVAAEYWTLHGQVAVREPAVGPLQYWAKGEGAPDFQVSGMSMTIDGYAGTGMTEWNGDTNLLGWIGYDVTAIGYHIRKNGDAAIIGVGGGRDLLTALWAESRSVVGIEINKAFIHILTGPQRFYASIATHPSVTLVHDEARSYLTRVKQKYDILQMSLIDTWAATGAGAFTLSENGLYTVDGWRVFLNRLKPRGIFSVSRWYSPSMASETSRLISLATAALLDRGVSHPIEHMALVTRGPIASLLLSIDPLDETDIRKLRSVSRRMGFDILLMPGEPSKEPLLAAIAASSSRTELDELVENQPYDYTPPTDQKPYFFNILKPASLFTVMATEKSMGVVGEGNLMATRILLVLWFVSAILVAAVILGPLVKAGLPSLDRASFSYAVAYFAAIGLGFMWVQIPLMQRFSIYLGHPTYAVSVILFSMILAAGLGSLTSDRIDVEHQTRWLIIIPTTIAVILLALTLSLQKVFDLTIQQGLATRCLVVVTMVGVPAFFMGFCFPMGLRIVRRLADDALPWMWGVNGACSVLASVTAVAISMWSGINNNLFLAVAAYLVLIVPALKLAKK
ncbi:MAG: hypothetical protein JXA30_23220 [Deltaproteobacteria bacterium]|nr:hypothetical protein [Deltaproteobacteria bacterium]